MEPNQQMTYEGFTYLEANVVVVDTAVQALRLFDTHWYHLIAISLALVLHPTMNLVIISLALFMTRASSFSLRRTVVKRSTAIFNNGMDMSGNTWKPASEKMGSTDTGDFFPEGYNAEEEIAFSSGMMGSQEMLSGGKRSGPQLPGMENLGADAVIRGGIETASGIPAGMQFIPSAMPDGEFSFQVASSGSGKWKCSSSSSGDGAVVNVISPLPLPH